MLPAAVEFVQSRCLTPPTAAIILGSGLGGFADQIEDAIAIPYAEIPGFGTASASGHRGQLILGRVDSISVIAMAGRFHRYEGWSNAEVAFPVRLMAKLGATRLIVSNAAGGVNPKLRVGDILVIRDHINFMGGNFIGSDHLGSLALTRNSVDEAETGEANPIAGSILRRRGEIYDDPMSRAAMRVAVEQNFNAYEGTYLATLGPTYETRSEYRMMRRIGADVAGMSTVPEVLAATDVKMRILGISMVSNVASPDRPVKADHAEVLEAGRAAAVKMESILRGALRVH